MKRLVLAGLLIVSSPAAWADASPTTAHVWLPGEPNLQLAAHADLLYAGIDGHIVRVDRSVSPTLIAVGGRELPHPLDASLYVFFVSDARVAEFHAPARVLHRLGHEVVVSTHEATTPRLTGSARDRLASYTQAVRVPDAGIAWPRTRQTEPRADVTIDPMIEVMVGELSTASYGTTWQALEDFGTRYTAAPENEQATQWILDQLLSFGLDAEFHEYGQPGTWERNVVATIPGTVDPSRAVYLTGHLDSTSSTPFDCAPGADDNASGTTAVIEAARVLRGYTFAYTIKFVCFNGEEQGLLGSQSYVADVAASGVEVIANLNADMISYAGADLPPRDLVLYTDSPSQPLAQTVADAIDTYVTAVNPVIVVERMGASDHASFWAYGYDAVLAIEDELFGPNFNPWLHTCQDLIVNGDLDYATSCARGLLAAVAEIAVPTGIAVSVADDVTSVAVIGPARPNPARFLTRIPIYLDADGVVALRVFDLQGRAVRTLMESRVDAGPREITFDGRDDAGRPLADGVYFYRLRVGDRTQTRRLVLVR